MHPVIGITCCYDDKDNRYHIASDYIQAVKTAGGIPFIIPHADKDTAKRFFNQIDGLLLSGGVDIDPLCFAEEPLPWNGAIDPQRDFFELEITSMALVEKMPVLGICRGMQVINVAAGGSICQDIRYASTNYLKHNQDAPRWYPTHSIDIIKESLLYKTMGVEEIKVNSFHHQVVGRIASCFNVSAYSRDGIIEAIEIADDKNFFALGVQFHPENMWMKFPRFLKIFEKHIQASTSFCRGKMLKSKG